MTYVITEACISTKALGCVRVYSVDCIYDGGDQFMINPEDFIDCGACERGVASMRSTRRTRSRRR